MVKGEHKFAFPECLDRKHTATVILQRAFLTPKTTYSVARVHIVAVFVFVCVLRMVRRRNASQRQRLDTLARLWFTSTLDWQNVWHTCRHLHCTTQLFPRSAWRVSFFVNIYILPLLVLFSLNAPLRSSPDVNHIRVVIYTQCWLSVQSHTCLNELWFRIHNLLVLLGPEPGLSIPAKMWLWIS